MKVLVTGSAGFLGSYIVRQLEAAGHEVVGLDLLEAVEASFKSGRLVGKPVTRLADITYDLTPHFEEGEIFDAVIHMAAIAAPSLCDKDPALAFNQNVQGTHNVLKLALRLKAKKVLLASSAHVYGISPRYMPTDERHPLWLQDTYTTTKILSEQLCELFHDNHGLSYIALRLFNGYGPGQTPGYLIPDLVAKAERGKVDLKGSNVTKDWVYVEDIADAFVRAVSSSFVGAINIGTGIETNLGQIGKFIADAYHVELNAFPVDAPTRMCADRQRANSVLGWSPTVILAEGLSRTIKGPVA